MRRFCIAVLLLTVAVFATGRTASAREIRQGDQCVINATETIQGNLFALCRTLDIQGHVLGNIFAAATSAKLSGTVDGDVYLAAGQLDVSGIIGDDLHFAGPVLRILPTAQFTSERANLVSLSLSTLVDKAVTIPGSVTNAGYQLVLNGNTGGEVSFWGSALRLTGTVGEDINAIVGDPASTGISQLQTFLVPFGWDVELINPGLQLQEGSAVTGNLRYTGPVEAELEGTVAGETIFTQVATQTDLSQIINNEDGAENGILLYISQASRELVVLGLIGLLGLLFLPRQLQTPIRVIQSRPLPSVGVGLLTFIISFPIALIVLLFILILTLLFVLLHFDGLVITLVGGAFIGTWGGLVSLFYFTAIFISRVIVCLVVGRWAVRAILNDDGTPRVMFISLLTGAVLFSLLNSLPVIGLIASAVSAFLGLGSVLIVIQAHLRRYRELLPATDPLTRPLPPALRRSDTLRPLPPPPLDDTKPPGMENLPQGFSWWGEDKDQE